MYAVPPYSFPPFFFLSRTEELVKAGTCAHDRRVLQWFALNVHIKHSDLTWPDQLSICGKEQAWYVSFSEAVNCFQEGSAFI